jgi:hypothetical protein
VDAEMSVAPAEFEDLWTWMYAKNPFGPLRAVVAQDEAGNIVGHEGIMPFRLCVDGRAVTGGITGNLIVKEELRGSLLFPRLVSALVKGLGSAGFDIGYGPVRPKMYASMLALGYRDMGPLPVYVRPYDLAKIAALYLRPPIARTLLTPFLNAAQGMGNVVFRARAKVPVLRVDRFGDEHRVFLERTTKQFPIHAERTPESLNWRYFAAPNRRYEVYEAIRADGERGYVALRRMPMLGFDALAIVDILFPLVHPEIGRALLAQVHRQALESGVTVVACMLNEGNPVIPMLQGAGFLRAPEGFKMIVYEPKSCEPIFRPGMLKRWYVTWFDHDYV